MGYPKPFCKRLILGATVIIASLLSSIICNETPPRMTREEREDLKEEARDMFYHAYRAYMENAYPADELMPLSCAGRYRGLAPNRGDMDDILGNFSLTLIDTLDTLVILGDLEEFEHAVKLIVTDVSFDSNIVVSVFETNIRVLGGLLSGHVLAEYLQQRAGILQWYRGELLDMAKDLGFRLMPAFNTTTGIPHARINLKHGMKGERLEASRETCTACAGTMILEMAALSRLTGEPIFEEKAHRAMDELWKMRHRSSDLMGTILNVHSGDWVRRDSGVGAGIDSYYEYCLKAYILLGEERYLNRFNRHYSAVMKYVSQGPMLLDVHMHRPHTNSRNFMDALLAFWPGLQVLKGDIKPAVETHEMLYQVMQRHKFIPEAFTTDFQVHWGQHPLRPEFLESTYFLHRATNDPYYLEVGRNVLKSLQKYARVPCGYAAVNDVRTGKHEDRMDSFVLAETFKYLFLLFATEQELLLDLNEFIFTTEAHLLPLSLAANSNRTINAALDTANDGEVDDSEFARTCPNTFHLFPESVRRPLRNMVDGVCPRRLPKRRLTASEFQVSDPHHMNIIKDMGINILALSDGRIQLLHTFSSARSTADAEEGLLFMQEMVELSKAQAQQPDALPQGLVFPFRGSQVLVMAGPSHFSPELREDQRVTGRLAVANPFRACGDLQDTQSIKDRIVVIERGDCMFVDKARRLQRAGAIAGIVVDNTPGSSASTSPMFAMSGDGTDDVKIPVVFLFAEDASKLLLAATANPGIEVTIGELKSLKAEFALSSEETVLQKIKLAVDELNSRRTSKSTLETSLGDFHASLNHGTFKIMHKKSDSAVKVPEETKEINPKWAGLRKYIVLHLLGEDDRELSITPNILSLYYQSYSGASEIEIQKDDPKVQIEWLLTQLQTELNELNNGSLKKDKIEVNAEGLKLISDEQLKWQLKQIGDNVHIKINSILETISKLQNNIGEIRKQFSDDLIIKDVKDNVDKVIESASDETRTGSDSPESTDEIVTARPKINDEL